MIKNLPDHKIIKTFSRPVPTVTIRLLEPQRRFLQPQGNPRATKKVTRAIKKVSEATEIKMFSRGTE